MFFKISCEKANEICNKAQYNKVSFAEKVKLKWHLLFCKICQLYSKQNHLLTDICKQKSDDYKNNNFTLSNKDKEALKNELKKIKLK